VPFEQDRGAAPGLRSLAHAARQHQRAIFTREDGARLRPQWISTRFEELIKKYGLVQDKHSIEGWPIDRIARHHRIFVRTVQVATGGEPLPPIRFHDLRHGAATLALLGNVNMKVISETLGHARHSLTGR
jgi:integrase